CTAERAFTVTAPDAVNPVASPSQVSILYGETATVTVEPSDAEGSWSPLTFLTCADCPVTEASPPYSEVFVVSVSRNGCTGTDTVVVEVIQPELLIPPGFSPNGDGHNDLFQVIDRYIDEFLF